MLSSTVLTEVLFVNKFFVCFQHIQEYLDGADHGAIYFSLGSMLQAETFPIDKRDALLQAFSELPQRILWKWEADNLPGQPKNVRIEKWCPQLDILSKIFILY